jgi:DNA-binding CsgD family transcriptional regulator
VSSADLDRLALDEDRHLAPLSSVLPFLSAPARPYERHEVLRALHALLEALAAERPIVLALDDLHWADPASTDFLCRLLHRGIAHPSLLLLALRPGQAEARLPTALWEAERHGLVSWMELHPLSPGESEELLEDIQDRDLRTQIFCESGGNPLYLQQLAVAGELLVAAPGDAAETSEHGVPAPVSAAIRAEAEALSAQARILLEGAAVTGDPFEQALATHAAGMSAREALPALDELVASGLIGVTDTPGRFRFRHPIVRRAVYHATGAGWRLGSHGRVAAALEARGSPASARASHVERSAEPGDRAAVAVLTEAGDETMSHAPVSAAHWFAAASRLVPADAESLGHRLSLAGRRATALGVAGQMEESLLALDEFLALSPQEPSELRLQAAMFAGIFNELLGRQGRGRRILLEELARLPDQEGRAAGDLKRELAFTYFFDADWAAMAAAARQALACACEDMVRVGALSALALGEFGRHDLDEVRDAVSAGAALFDALTDEDVARHHPGIAGWLGWAEVCSEHYDDAIRHLERGIAICRRVGQRHQAIGLLFVKSQALALSGRVTELSADARTATEASLLTTSNLLLSWAMTARCQASLLAGELHEAVRFGERGAAASAASSPLSGIARVQLAEALLEVGEPERCRKELTGAEGHPDLPPFPLYEARCFELLARAELALGDDEAAEWFTKRAESSAGRTALMLPRAHAGRARAALLLHRGDAQAAITAALDAADMASRAHAPIEAARGRTIAGRALAAAGRRPEAIDALESANEQLIGCHAFFHADQAGRELRKLGRAVARRTQDDARPLGLTPRELEVITLVSAGRTNREIAVELVLSVRTVDRHVSRIFEKLRVKSRIAAVSAFERAGRAPSPGAVLGKPEAPLPEARRG